MVCTAEHVVHFTAKMGANCLLPSSFPSSHFSEEAVLFLSRRGIMPWLKQVCCCDKRINGLWWKLTLCLHSYFSPSSTLSLLAIFQNRSAGAGLAIYRILVRHQVPADCLMHICAGQKRSSRYYTMAKENNTEISNKHCQPQLRNALILSYLMLFDSVVM